MEFAITVLVFLALITLFVFTKNNAKKKAQEQQVSSKQGNQNSVVVPFRPASKQSNNVSSTRTIQKPNESTRRSPSQANNSLSLTSGDHNNPYNPTTLSLFNDDDTSHRSGTGHGVSSGGGGSSRSWDDSSSYARSSSSDSYSSSSSDSYSSSSSDSSGGSSSD